MKLYRILTIALPCNPPDREDIEAAKRIESVVMAQDGNVSVANEVLDADQYRRRLKQIDKMAGE